jgi:K+-sensing histidine kinase KdpD
MISRGIQFKPSDLTQMSITTEEIASEFLMFGANVWPGQISETLPSPSPLLDYAWSMAIIAFAFSVAIVIGPASAAAAGCTFALALLFLTLQQGPWFGIIAGVGFSLAHNLFVTPPAWVFTPYTQPEMVRLAFFVAIPIALTYAIRTPRFSPVAK